MSKSELVNCYLTGQDDSYEKPAKVLSRGEAHELKAMKLGQFENHGRTFRLTRAVAVMVEKLIDGPLGIGNLLPFAKIQNPQMAPEHLHYSIPACGAHAHGTSSPNFWRPPADEQIVLDALLEAFS